jgi:hypothetical protein
LNSTLVGGTEKACDSTAKTAGNENCKCLAARRPQPSRMVWMQFLVLSQQGNDRHTLPPRFLYYLRPLFGSPVAIISGMFSSACQIQFEYGATGNTAMCGKATVAQCADCGISICDDCRAECCGHSFCDCCYAYHEAYWCPRKPAQSDEGRNGKRSDAA